MEIEGLLGLADQGGDIVAFIDGVAALEEHCLGGALDELLGAADGLGGVVGDGASDAVEVLADRSRVSQVA